MIPYELCGCAAQTRVSEASLLETVEIQIDGLSANRTGESRSGPDLSYGVEFSCAH